MTGGKDSNSGKKMLKPYIHQVKYYECDRMGITHHSNYTRFMEEARIDFLDQLGYGFEKMEAEGVVSPVVSLECKFIRTTTFKDDICIKISVAELSPLKITFAYVMSVDGKEVFTGKSVHCFMADGRPVKIDSRWPELSEKLRSELSSD